ncbi:MAG: tRNA 2-thiouridine(34) synthase MnmA [bacterium]|nr:tRNA 2-thiouridine(34) synthase MnmA [bacterium]
MKAVRVERIKTSAKKPRVVVAMSGGVDSSVAAALLKEAGFEVIGVFMKFWTPRQTRGKQNRIENKCCSVEAQADARQVAAKLKIPFYTVNAEKEFKKRVVDYFIKEYAAGRTPNPCVECNHYIKFGLLLDKAKAFDADFLATGHYCRIKWKSQITNHKSQIVYKLLMAKDKNKDQSYFLYTLTQAKLKKIIFPIGDYAKSKVRKMAKKFGLPVFEKRDSQEVCFVNTDLYRFLRPRINADKGPIIATSGKKVGEHKGLAYYTIGQRKGLNIGGTGPYYVVQKDFKNNALIVANSDKDKLLYQKEMIIESVNWINLEPQRRVETKQGFSCKVKIRYLAQAVPAIIKKRKNGYSVVFNQPQKALTSGQAAVFYLKDELLGGGTIS